MSEKAPSVLERKNPASPENEDAVPVSYADVVSEMPEIAAIEYQVDSLADRGEQYAEGYERKIKQFESSEEVKKWLDDLKYALPDTIDAKSGEPKIDVQMWDGAKGERGEYVTVHDAVRKLLFIRGIDVNRNSVKSTISYPDSAGGFYELSLETGGVSYTTGRGTDNEYTERFVRDYAKNEKKLKLHYKNREKNYNVMHGLKRQTRSLAVNKALGAGEKEWMSSESSIVAEKSIDDERHEEMEKEYIELASQARGALEMIFEQNEDEITDAMRSYQKELSQKLSLNSPDQQGGESELRYLEKFLRSMKESDDR